MSMSVESFAAMVRGLGRAVEADPMDREQQEIAALVRDEVVNNFQREEDGEGQSWAPRVGNPRHLPLRETYAMYAAATVRGAPGNIEIRTRQELVVGVSGAEIDYAAKQNYGTAKIPAREYLYIRKIRFTRVEQPAVDGLKRILDRQIKQHQA